jgi:hypothetical protein
MFDVFISYAHTDRAFALDLQRRLEARGFGVWVDDEQMVPGEEVQDALVRGLEMSRNVIFVVTSAWVAGKWTRWEAEVSVHIGKGKQLVLIHRVPRDPLQLPAFLSTLVGVEWQEDESDPDARFWQVWQGLMGKSAGSRDFWSENGRAVPSGSPLPSQTVEEADSAAARRARLGWAEAPRYCDRERQWRQIKECADRTVTEAIFVQGSNDQGHKVFVEKVQACLPKFPPRRIISVSWEEWEQQQGLPESPDGFRRAIAEAVGCSEERLVRVLREQLASQNIWLVHLPVFFQRLKDKEDLFVDYYTKTLPELIARVQPDGLPSEGSGSIKVVQGIAWCPVPFAKAGFAWLVERLGLQKVKRFQKGIRFGEAWQYLEVKRALRKIRRKAHPRLQIFSLEELPDIEEKDLRDLSRMLQLQEKEEEQFLEEVLLGARSSAEILDRISRHQSRKNKEQR